MQYFHYITHPPSPSSQYIIQTHSSFHPGNVSLLKASPGSLPTDLHLRRRENLAAMLWILNPAVSCCCCVFQLWSRVQLFATSWTTAGQASLSFAISQNLVKLLSIELVMPVNCLILCCPLFLLPSIFPVYGSVYIPCIRIFSSASALHIRWPKYWIFSIVLSSEYSGLFPLGLTSLISLQSKGLSGGFSSITVVK